MKQGTVSLVIFTFVRKIEKPISFNANLLYWISVGIGVALGVLIAGYMLKRAKRKIEKNNYCSIFTND